MDLLTTPQFVLRSTDEGYIITAMLASGEAINLGPEPKTMRGLANAMRLCAMILEGKLKLSGTYKQAKPELVKTPAIVLKLFK